MEIMLRPMAPKSNPYFNKGPYVTHGTTQRQTQRKRHTETELRSGSLAELWHKISISESSFETGILIQSCYTTHVEKQKTLEICARFLEQTLQPNPKRFWRQTETERQRETRDA
jgi:hypothetical protein